MIRVCPSSNPCPECDMVDYAKSLQKIGVEIFHLDVMDGKFVSNKHLSSSAVKNLKENCNIFLDAHFMAVKPLKVIKEYLSCNLNYITTHFEAYSSCKQILKAIDLVKNKGVLFGLSIKPETPIEKILNYLPLIDLVLIMSVNPGKSGQTFIVESLEKIAKLRNIVDKNGFKVKIEVDGGINKENYKMVVDAGADMLVMGSAFYNSDNKKELLKSIENCK